MAHIQTPTKLLITMIELYLWPKDCHKYVFKKYLADPNIY